MSSGEPSSMGEEEKSSRRTMILTYCSECKSQRNQTPLSNSALQPPLVPLLSSASEFQKDSMPTLNWIGKEAVVNR
jgi:hypothetical protein